MKLLRRLLEHPLTRGLDLDAPGTTLLRRHVIRSKPLLEGVYRDWYRTLAAEVPAGPGGVVELGSGGGFLEEVLPGVLTSDVFWMPGIRLVLDGGELPFCPGSLRGVVMTNVLHHVRKPRNLMVELARALRPGGVVAMLEPWSTPFSRFVYRGFHSEPFDPDTEEWELPPGGPLSNANQALPWVVFSRDRERFLREFPEFAIRSIRPTMPIRFLVSGGVATRNILPAWTDRLWRALERAPGLNTARTALFAYIVLERIVVGKPGPTPAAIFRDSVSRPANPD